MEKELLQELLREPGFIKSAGTIERLSGGGIKFFANFDVTGLTSREIVDKNHRFETKYNGLIDVKLDGGIGIEKKHPGFLSGKAVLTAEERGGLEEQYYEELVEILRCFEDESKRTLITSL